jgi:hypothetical protein
LLLALFGAVIPSAMSLVTGLIGLANWVVGLVGMGVAIAGPSRCRGLAIAATSVAVVHLVLAFIVVNDTDSLVGSNLTLPLFSSLNRMESAQQLQKELSKEIQKNPGSAKAKELQEELKSYSDDSSVIIIGGDSRSSRSKMRWGDFTTFQTQFDRLIAILSYSSKAFSNYLLGMFCGMAEVARLILLILLVGSMARVAKHYGAETKARIGWIAAASASGAALLAMLLCFVIADSIGSDTKKAVADAPPNMSGMTFEQARKANEEWIDKQTEKNNSRLRAPFRWLAIVELLCFVIHVGTLVLPIMAGLAVFSSTGAARVPKSKARDRERDLDDGDDRDRGRPPRRDRDRDDDDDEDDRNRGRSRSRRRARDDDDD